jgi:hypothetical protein
MQYIGDGVQKAYENIFRSDPSMRDDFRIHTPVSVVLLLNVIERMGYHEYIDQSKPQRIIEKSEVKK